MYKFKYNIVCSPYYEKPWAVMNKHGKVLKRFTDQSEAQDWVQQSIQADRDFEVEGRNG